MKAINCNSGSAWHSWQIEGNQWAKDNPLQDSVKAAESFCNLPGWPNAAKDARYQAFLEGAKHYQLGVK